MPETTIDSSAQTENLQLLLKELGSEIERCARYHHSLTIAVVCIDTIAELRQTLGTLATEAVLSSIATILKTNLGQNDSCIRLDNQSFIMILSELSAAHAARTAQKIKDKIDSHTITYNWQNLKVSISIGLASYPIHGNEPDKLIASATAAMQFALNSGGNRIVIA
jgi:diguanylate cyclase (GGDEF)-like protein